MDECKNVVAWQNKRSHLARARRLYWWYAPPISTHHLPHNAHSMTVINSGLTHNGFPSLSAHRFHPWMHKQIRTALWCTSSKTSIVRQCNTKTAAFAPRSAAYLPAAVRLFVYPPSSSRSQRCCNPFAVPFITLVVTSCAAGGGAFPRRRHWWLWCWTFRCADWPRRLDRRCGHGCL